MVLAALLLFSCDKPFEMDLPLAVNSRKLSLGSAAGSTHILVWSNGNWTAELDRNIEWGSLNKREGAGNNDILFSYSANYGVTRYVRLILANGEVRDTVELVQKGMLSGDNVSLSFKSREISLLKNASGLSSPIQTSLLYSADMFVPSVEFFDADGVSQGVVVAGKDIPDTLHVTPWISDMKIVGDGGPKLSFVVGENAGDAPRSAVMTLTVAAADGSLYSARQSITQTADGPVLTLESSEGEYDGFGSPCLAPTLENNVYLYSSYLTYESDSEWISAVSLNADGITFKTERNESEAARTGNVTVTFNDGAGSVLRVSHKVVQRPFPGAVSFEALRAMEPGIINTEGFIEGYIISDKNGANVCQNPQTAQYMFDFTASQRTAYIESSDTRYGVRLLFESADDNITRRGSKVRISLGGLNLVRQSDPLCFSLEGLTADNVLESLTPPDDYAIPAKRKSISEISDEDIFTLVTLQDVEIMCKDGAYTNCIESYSIKDNAVNPVSGSETSPRWDVAPLLMSDRSGNSIYMLTNALAPWRRNGTVYGNGTDVVAQGSGSFRGVITSEDLVRYGELGRYKIRPMSSGDILLSKPAFSKTVVEWNWNDEQTDLVPEAGSGELNFYGADIVGAPDYNSMMCHEISETGEKVGGRVGLVTDAAIRVTRKWWDFSNDRGEYFDISFSTAGISGENMVFGIVWNHGQQNDKTLDSPAHWNLLYSVDGGTEFKSVPGSSVIGNRSIVWWGGTGQDACPGYKDHMRKLPAECFGKQKVVLRLQVADKITDKKPSSSASTYLTNLGIEKATLTDKATSIRIGTITVRYN